MSEPESDESLSIIAGVSNLDDDLCFDDDDFDVDLNNSKSE